MYFDPQTGLVIPITSKYLNAVWQSSEIVFSHALDVICSDDDGMFAVIQSGLHSVWAWSYGSTMKSDLRYTPSDVFETFPFPPLDDLRKIGKEFYEAREEICSNRNIGITEVYNMFHNPKCLDEDVVKLRRLQEIMDDAVMKSYGWDLQCDHAFYLENQRVSETTDLQKGDQVRYGFSAAMRRNILKLLLRINHERASLEIHPAKPKTAKNAKSQREAAKKDSAKSFELNHQTTQPKLF